VISSSEENKPSISVVINTLNRADLLDDAIRSVSQLDYPAYELIVVNGPSTDHTETVIARWAGKIKQLRCGDANLSISRNVGIAAAAGEIVAFLDDDAVPHSAWLTHLARHYGDRSVGGVGGFTVDNTGVQWQVRKTICDRFGNAYYVDDLFDERSLNFPGTPYFSSLLGTNSSFRRTALQAIGGFDHTFAYLLDETDVCLRLVDAGWKILYEPAAMIFHQFAESHVRSATRKPKTLYPSVVSKTYFINRHGPVEGFGEVSRALESYREEIFRANAWLADHGEISSAHRASLDADVDQGTKAGIMASYQALVEEKTKGDLPDEEPAPLIPMKDGGRLRVVLVSQGFPPENDAGIARWTSLLATGLCELGIDVHVVSRAKNLPNRHYRNGIWYHAIVADKEGASAIANRYDVPSTGVADWMAAVMREIEFIKTFGLDLVSFPIWDIEALPVLDDIDVACVMSLHTTYKLAKPFKPEWNARIIYGRGFVNRMIAAESAALVRAPAILANSNAVMSEIEAAYGVEISQRSRVVSHGTPDILANQGISLSDKRNRNGRGGPLRVLVPGRFELRKGYDLALGVAAAMAGNKSIQFEFVGNTVNESVREIARRDCGIDPLDLCNCKFHGEVDRAQLDERYVLCDVVLMPSRFESFGLVAIEAMSAGSPVIALAAGGLAEVVEHGISGWLIAERAFVVEAVDILNRLSGDQSELARIGASAYERFSERFSVPVMAAGVAAYYREAVTAQGRGK
jgi:glycosyltransferase involved in cell wall biosynthesis/GT2 family glycosyltransferase